MTRPSAFFTPDAFDAVSYIRKVIIGETRRGCDVDRTQLTSTNGDLVEAIDRLLREVYPPREPGASAIVVKGGQVVYRKGFGMANLELGVPMRADYIFRIGSITKQFTAVAILMLVGEGKLALDDDISTFLPDYPTHGHRLTVEHLLTHTSGIKSYTSRSDFREIWRKDVTVPELIGLFKDLPMEFAPGERYNYSNSGYVLLGAIVEAVSGQAYAEFLEQRIFQPLELGQTSCDRTERIVPGRAAGYDRDPTDWQNAGFVSMTQPYAAGALISTVDDLAKWDEALYTDRLVAPSLLERAWTPFRLNDGSSTGYGYGWGIGSYAGHRLIQHGGGIPGFITQALRLPDDQVFVAVLTNSTGKDPGPHQLALKIGGLAIGQPYEEPVPISLPSETLDQFVGVYRVRAKELRTVLREGDKILLQWSDGPKQEIIPLADDEFFVKDDSFTRIRFVHNQEGRPASLEIRGTGPTEVATKVEERADTG
jgi:D-alanyl-D-alanine carboxypeptidase